MPLIDLRAGLDAEDDEGRWWSLLTDARNPEAVRSGAFWSPDRSGLWCSSSRSTPAGNCTSWRSPRTIRRLGSSSLIDLGNRW